MRSMQKQTSSIDSDNQEPSIWIQANTAAELASDIQAREIALVDITSWTTIADYFIVMTADNPRQMAAIDQAVSKGLRSIGVKLSQREGSADSGWLVLDFGAIIVHVFSSETRSHYRVDALWNTGNALLTMQ